MTPTHTLPTAEAVSDLAHALGQFLDHNQSLLISQYLNLLIKWNARMNLVGPGAWPEILEILIQDSWHLARFLCKFQDPAETLDLGAGAGLPGIPLRIFWQPGEYYLIEPRQKRAIFMEWAVALMKLSRTHVLCTRMEDLPLARRQADLIVSRAFKPWPILLRDVRGYLALGGQVLIMSNTAQPETSVDEYRLEATQDYVVAGKKRSFWLFTFVGERL